jgi:hypothetical protein
VWLQYRALPDAEFAFVTTHGARDGMWHIDSRRERKEVKAAPPRLSAVTFGPSRSWRTRRKWETPAGVGLMTKSNKTVTIP